MSNSITPSRNAEEEVSIRAITRNYGLATGQTERKDLTPKDIYNIAAGEQEGDREAALSAFAIMGRHLGDVIANLVSLTDGLVVMGGGIAGADRFFMSSLMQELGRNFDFRQHDPIPRLIQKAFNLNDEAGQKGLCEISGKFIDLPGGNDQVYYDEQAKVAIGTSRIGTTRAISLGAYAFALNQLGS
jgi:glucokinase